MKPLCKSLIALEESEELIINGELVYAMPCGRQRLTKKRIAATYGPGGGKLAPFQRVYSVGLDPVSAISALGSKMKWSKLADFRFESDQRHGEWYWRFTADGTSMKAGGRYVPGGALVDWWK